MTGVRDGMPAGAGLKRRRQEHISEHIKDLIVERGLRPGERLPAERELMEHFQASRGSVREALSALRSQGLIRTRSGPGGGVFLSDIEPQRAMALMSNYFLFRTPSIADIYAIRCRLEPELAAAVADHLSESDFSKLERTLRIYDAPPRTAEEEYRQRLAELDFHSVLAEVCPNALLGLFCGFLQKLLRELVTVRKLYDQPHPELRDAALHYQLELMRALRARDAGTARQVMAEHMEAARDYMLRLEASLATGILRD